MEGKRCPLRHEGMDCMKKIRFVLLVYTLGVCLPAPQAAAGTSGFRIESVKQVDADPTMAEVDLVVSNDGSQGDLYMTAFVKSRDGTIHGGGAAAGPTPVPKGRHVHVTVFVGRPPGPAAQHSDVLIAWVQDRAWHTVAMPCIDWSHDWPALAGSAGGAPVATDVPSERQPGAPAGTDGLLPRQDLTQAIRTNLGDGDFAALDLLFQEWNNPAVRDASGNWKLEAFNAAFTELASENWDGAMATVRRWKAFNPKSPGAAVAEARLWMAHAWQGVGSCACGGRQKPTPVSGLLFNQRIGHVEQALRASRAYASGNPLWYQAYLELAVATRRDAAFTQGLFDEAVTRHPLYQPLYLAMARYWLPGENRPGNWPPVAALGQQLVRLSQASDGDDNYAWFYARIDAGLPLEENLLWRGPLPWTRLRQSFRDLVRRYPSADNYNLFARSACRAHDRETYMELAVKIRHDIEPDLWPNNFSMDMCNHAFMERHPASKPTQRAATSI
jgi:hypothetical protein